MQDHESPHQGVLNAPTHSPVTKPPRRILVVDDDTNIREISAKVLVRSGYQVEVAENGAEGLEALRLKPYDLLITDNSMPMVTGIELVKKLREQNATLPIILASGEIPTEELKQHPWLGIGAILNKPYSVNELLRAVSEVLLRACPKISSGPAIFGQALSVSGTGNREQNSVAAMPRNGSMARLSPPGDATC